MKTLKKPETCLIDLYGGKDCSEARLYVGRKTYIPLTPVTENIPLIEGVQPIVMRTKALLTYWGIDFVVRREGFAVWTDLSLRFSSHCEAVKGDIWPMME